MQILNHVKRALKFIFKFRSHTVFSLVGLVIGLACVFIISAWTIQELRFDRFHHQSDHIYMLTTDVKDRKGTVKRYPETPAPLAAALAEQIPQIESSFHFYYLYGGRSVGTQKSAFKEKGIAATPEFLEVLNFQLVSGRAQALDDPKSIFLSKSLADKIFPGADALSKELIYQDTLVLVVKGVFKDVPFNSSLQFDFLVSYGIEYGFSDSWWQLSDASFIKTSQSADIEEVKLLMEKVWSEHITDEQYGIGYIPIVDLRYGADFEFFNAEHGHGNRKKLYMFMGVAALILILACLNYLNLISAYAVKLEKDVWLRKIHGASTANIANYFIVESVLLSVVAWGFATLFSLLGLRIFENILGVVISPFYFHNTVWLGLPGAMIIVGLASGFYPAIRAGSKVLLNSNASGKPNVIFQAKLRNAFVMNQFVLSIALAISCLLIIRQTDFMKKFETGYAKQDIVSYKLPSENDSVLYNLNNWLDGNPNVEGFTFASASPVSLTVLSTTEKWRWEGLEEGAFTSIYRLFVDENYADVYQLNLSEGRFFSSMDTDQNRIVINEKLAGLIGFEDPIGHLLRRGEEEYEIIGVVKDFNFQHLSNEIGPLMFMSTGRNGHLYVKIRSDAEGTIALIQEQISKLSDHPVNYSFIEDEYDLLYEGEQQILSGVMIFTVLSILLSSLGLIGLVTHGTETKTREMAVRKVYGADSRNIMITLNLSLLKIFIPSVVIGSLIAWLVMRGWLMNYSYRRGFEGWLFLSGALIILLVALISVSIQTWKAAKLSPASALKNL